MPNPYFTNTIDLLPGNRARASNVEANLSAVEAAFDAVARDLVTGLVGNSQHITTNTQAVYGGVYVFGAALTLLLPPSPAANDWVAFVDQSGTQSCVLGRNGSNICGLAQDVNIDVPRAYGRLIYVDATRGWVFF